MQIKSFKTWKIKDLYLYNNFAKFVLLIIPLFFIEEMGS